MAYSLVAVDLDGTLLQWKTQQDRDSEDSATPSISPANAEALRRVSSDGATVVIATGRGPASASRVADDVLSLPCPLVCNNGACVLSAPSAGVSGRRVVIQGSFYPREFVAGVAEIGGSVNTLVCIYHPDPESPSGCAISFSGCVPDDVSLGSINLMVCADEFPMRDDPRLTATQRDIVANSRNSICYHETHEALAASPAAAHCWKLLVWAVGSNRDRLAARIEEELEPASYGITMHRPEVMLLEYVPPHVNKASALAVLSKALGVAQERTLCFGDGTNDVEMLRWAGLGVAMGNANEKAKAAASRVSEWPHHEDAVAKEISRTFGLET